MEGKQKRLTAKRALAEDLLNGEYHTREGFQSNYLVTPQGQRVSRVKIVATVATKFVSDDENYAFIVLDDGTETIRTKFFQDLKDFKKVEEGDLIVVVGKLREYEEEVYVNPEVVRKVEDPNTLTLNLAEVARGLSEVEKDKEIMEELKENNPDSYEGLLADEIGVERARALLRSEELEEDISSGKEEGEEDSELRNEVLETIEEVDEGEGASYQEMIEKIDAEEEKIDNVINDLLTEGTCFEPRPGKIKKL
ncbi:MAG: OB-fold nucleic acid binding domain-containing protein [Candidatus Aenigmatarchaeota archaeon]